MTKDRLVKLSKFLSYILRHNPDMLDLEMDTAGWVNINALVEKVRKRDKSITHNEIMTVVELNGKKRFSISVDNYFIRANQGHTVKVELGYEAVEPPTFLFHGTVQRYLDSIRKKGLDKKGRHHVHLSPDVETAAIVGKRKGEPVILKIKAKEMYTNNYKFFCTDNNVWLTVGVPLEYIIFPK